MPDYSQGLKRAISAAKATARAERRLVTPEHLLLNLIGEPDAARVISACGGSPLNLQKHLIGILSEKEAPLSVSDKDPEVTEEFQLIINEAISRSADSLSKEVTGADAMVAFYKIEKNTNALRLLLSQNIKYDSIIRFLKNGIEEESPIVIEDTVLGLEDEDAYLHNSKTAKSTNIMSSDILSTTEDDHIKPDRPYIFLSYSNKDSTVANQLHRLILEENLPVWWDQDINPGSLWREEIASRIKLSKAVLVLWTKNSVKSNHVIEEASLAQETRRLVHIKLEDVDLPYGFSETQHINFVAEKIPYTHSALRRVIEALKIKLYSPEPRYIRELVINSSPISTIINNGKLSQSDNLSNARPQIDDPDDLDERLGALVSLSSVLIKMADDRNVFQAHPCAIHSFKAIEIAAITKPVTWYSLEDSSCLLQSCIDSTEAEFTWNGSLYAGANRLLKRIDEVSKLIKPIKDESNNHKMSLETPPVTILNHEVPELLSASLEVRKIASSNSSDVVLNPDLKENIFRAADQISEAATHYADSTRRFLLLRRGLIKLTFVVSSVVVATTGGVLVNLLTTPNAAHVLSNQLQPLLERLLRFFY